MKLCKPSARFEWNKKINLSTFHHFGCSAFSCWLWKTRNFCLIPKPASDFGLLANRILPTSVHSPIKFLMQNGNCMHTHTKREQKMPQVRLCIFNAKTRTLPTKTNTWYIYKSRLVKLASLVFMIISYFVEVFRQLNGFHVSFHSFVFILNFIIFFRNICSSFCLCFISLTRKV